MSLNMFSSNAMDSSTPPRTERSPLKRPDSPTISRLSSLVSSDFGPRHSRSMLDSPEELPIITSDDDSEAPVRASRKSKPLPGIDDFDPELLFEESNLPAILIEFQGTSHMFIGGGSSQNSGFNPLMEQALSENGPENVHVLDKSAFFGPLSVFMSMLQHKFGIDSDVALEFAALSLYIPINMGFANSGSLSLAHLSAVAAAAADESLRSPPLLSARLIVEPSNFVKKYNQLVHNFKSKQSLSISTSPTSQRKVQARWHTSQGLEDENSEEGGSHSPSSRSSSPWSHLAVRDTASVAVLSDNESMGYESMDVETHPRRSFSRRPSTARRGYTTDDYDRTKLNASNSMEEDHDIRLQPSSSSTNPRTSSIGLDSFAAPFVRSHSHMASLAPGPIDLLSTPSPTEPISRKRPRGTGVPNPPPAIADSGDESLEPPGDHIKRARLTADSASSSANS